VDGWLQKNEDKLPLQLGNIIEKCKSDYLLRIYGHKDSPLDEIQSPFASSSMKSKKRSKKATIANRFVTQLRDLAKTLDSTNPHYVRCVKPNEVRKGCWRCWIAKREHLFLSHTSLTLSLSLSPSHAHTYLFVSTNYSIHTGTHATHRR
jgi:hypothetical protein